jgi:hypothetical protein
VQEIARQDPGRLAGKELPPGRGGPARRGREPGRGQDPADGSRAGAMAEAEELALDAPVPPPWVLPGILNGCLKTGTLYDEATAWSHRVTLPSALDN